MGIKGVIFDFHGTLATRLAPTVDSLLNRLRSLGYEVYKQPFDAAWKYVNFLEHPKRNFSSWEEVVQRLMGHLGLEARPGDLPSVVELLAREEWPLMGDAIPCLRTLGGRYRSVVVTSIMAFRIREALEPLRPYLHGQGLITSPDAGVPKPHPRIFRRALEELGLAAEEVAIVGDEADVDLPVPRELGIMPIYLDRAVARDVPDVPTIGGLGELPGLLVALDRG